jgi:acetylornithine deacetylase/succinyl-diaminopimelate desuccinylase-like protein
MKTPLLSSLLTVASALAAMPAAAQTPPADAAHASLRAIYREMVEIDSSAATGSCSRVAKAAQARLQAAGFAPADMEFVAPEGKPEEGNLVVHMPGSDPSQKAVLLLAHIDVVEARRADWERDPYTLVEENGFFFGRGTADDKAMAAIFLDLMISLKREGFAPRRELKLALTCGEETSNLTNGVDYLLKNRRDLLDAEFALNEGAGGILSPEGKPLALEIQAGEKIHQVITLEVTNPGGHSSQPNPEGNAIYQLAEALKKLERFQFPVELTPVTRASFAALGPLEGGAVGKAMVALSKNPLDARALALLSGQREWNPQLRTTCVATMLQAGHAANALPQRARATVSCRTMQTLSPDALIATLEKAIGDPRVKVTLEKRREGSQPPRLTEEFMAPVRRAAQRMWPGVVIAPRMSAGATDGRFLMNAGIPTYGVSGIFSVPNEENAHGLNEKLRVKSLYEGREFLEAIVRDYAGPAN